MPNDRELPGMLIKKLKKKKKKQPALVLPILSFSATIME
jgi:hypothetical protein